LESNVGLVKQVIDDRYSTWEVFLPRMAVYSHPGVTWFFNDTENDIFGFVWNALNSSIFKTFQFVRAQGRPKFYPVEYIE
jgi:hypothetical protein